MAYILEYSQYLRSNDMLNSQSLGIEDYQWYLNHRDSLPTEPPSETTNDTPDITISMNNISNNIDTITNDINKLTQQRSNYITLLQNYTVINLKMIGLFSPIHQMPPEILGEILLLCIPTLAESSMVNWCTILQIFLNVCHQWRTIALNNPYLWNHLHLYFEQSQSLRKAIYLLLSWTKHMGPWRKLNLTIHYPYLCNNPSEIRTIYKVLQPLHQIHNLQLIAMDLDFQNHLSELYDAAPSLLEKLTLIPLTGTYHIPVRPRAVVLPENMLKPKYLTIKGHNLDFLFHSTYEHVTNLTLESNTFYIEDFWQVLKMCINVKELRLIIRSPLTFAAPIQDNIVLPSLQSLYVKTHQILPHILASITAPNIKTIHIHKEENFLSTNVRSIIPFMHTLPNLHTITIDGFRIMREKTLFENSLLNSEFIIKPDISWNEWDHNDHPITNLANYIQSTTINSNYEIDTDLSEEIWETSFEPEEIESD
jgi:hypothetical protein